MSPANTGRTEVMMDRHCGNVSVVQVYGVWLMMPGGGTSKATAGESIQAEEERL
jgi:hypothetical protein